MGDALQPSHLLPLSPPFAFSLSQHQGLLQQIGSSDQVAKVLGFSITVQKSNSLALSLLYGPTLTSVHNYWENYSFDYANLCWQSDISTFSYTV